VHCNFTFRISSQGPRSTELFPATTRNEPAAAAEGRHIWSRVAPVTALLLGSAGYLFKTECKWENKCQFDSHQWMSNCHNISQRSILTQFRLIRLLSGSNKNKRYTRILLKHIKLHVQYTLPTISIWDLFVFKSLAGPPRTPFQPFYRIVLFILIIKPTAGPSGPAV